MTVPIPHGEAVRNAVRVEWMRLDDREALRQAGEWLEAHGVQSDFYPFSGDLRVLGGPGESNMRARLGQVLAFNPASGEFTVWEPEHFQAAHSEVAGVRG